ncbi:MAG: hypothetical protein AAFP10_00050 [Pseudomonadota bacterium]
MTPEQPMYPTRPVVTTRITSRISLICLLICLQGCLSLSVTRYDHTTYVNLTRLKAETTLLLNRFDQAAVSDTQPAIDTTTLNLQAAYEYEVGKGEKNHGTVKQFDRIMQLFRQDVTDYQENGPGAFGKSYFQEAASTLGQAFDIVIATENSKNPD